MHLALIIHFPLPVKVNILAFALLLLNLGRYQITRKRGSCFFTAPKDLVVYLDALDLNKRSSTKTLNLMNDEEGPFIELTSPLDQQTYNFQIDIIGKVRNGEFDYGLNEIASLEYEIPAKGLTVSITDPQGTDAADYNVAYVPFDPDGAGPLLPTYSDFSSSYTIDVASSTLRVKVRAADKNGNVTEEIVDLIDSATGPEIVYEFPVPGATNYHYASNHVVPIPIEAIAVEPNSVNLLSYQVRSPTFQLVTPEPIPTTTLIADGGKFSFDVDLAAVVAQSNPGDSVSVTILAKDVIGRISETEIVLHDDTVGPSLVSHALANDNSYVDITFAGGGGVDDTEGVWTSPFRGGPVVVEDLELLLDFSSNDLEGDGATGLTVGKVTKNDSVLRNNATPLAGGETVIRAWLDIIGLPDGLDKFTPKAAQTSDGHANAIYDHGSFPIQSPYDTVITLNDQKPPQILAAETLDLDVNGVDGEIGKIDRIKVTLSEDVDSASAGDANAFSVSGHTVESSARDASNHNIVWLTIDEPLGATYNTEERPDVTINADVLSDIAGNTRSDLPFVTAVDTALPAIVAATTGDISPDIGGELGNGKIDRLIVTFSEAVDAATLSTTTAILCLVESFLKK